ncbi:MAG: hypothetical protein ABI693_17545 [Bryobacteraceae bacterium]
MTRIVLDQGLAPAAAETLRNFGFDAVLTALKEHRVCVTARRLYPKCCDLRGFEEHPYPAASLSNESTA